MINLYDLTFGSAYAAVLTQVCSKINKGEKNEIVTTEGHYIKVHRRGSQYFNLVYSKRTQTQQERITIESSHAKPEVYLILYSKLNSSDECVENNMSSKEIAYVMQTLRKEFNL